MLEVYRKHNQQISKVLCVVGSDAKSRVLLVLGWAMKSPVLKVKLDWNKGPRDIGYLVVGKPGAADAYAAALYWSIMTLTSIGYGQMLPVNTAERFLWQEG